MRLRDLVNGKYGLLLLALLFLIVVLPAVTHLSIAGLLIDMILTGVLLTSLYASRPRRATLAVGAALVVLNLAIHEAADMLGHRTLYLAHYGLDFAILAFSILSILGTVLDHDRVTLDTIEGALCIYILLGVAWAFHYAMIDVVLPGSFSITPSPEGARMGFLLIRHRFPRLLYFSLSTLTTLGYGDIIPRSGPAQMAACVEAVLGQFYLTVLVARLVSIQVSQPAAPRARDGVRSEHP